MNPPPRSLPARGTAGFTILEVAMAVAVLALVFISAVTAFQSAFLQLDSARNLSTAAAILHTELEKERMLPWATVSDVNYAPAIDSGFTRSPLLAGRFTLTRTVTTVAGHGGLMVQITLNVRWRGYDGRQLARTVTTYYAQGGLNAYYLSPS